MIVHLVNPSNISFGTAVITPRWLYMLAAGTPASFGDPHIVDETLEQLASGCIQPGDVVEIGIRTRRKACSLYFRYLRLVVFAVTILNLSLRLEGATTLQSQEVISRIDKAQLKREQRLAGYAAMEHYTVRNSHFEKTAELEAKVVYQKDLGKSYQVLRRKGPHLLQERVINRILKEDALLSRSSERSHTLLTSANYSMTVQGMQRLQGEQCYIVNIRPRMHKFSLIEGTAWIDAEDFSLLRIEGRPADSPSFWTGRPYIEREYTVLDGLSFPKHSRATSKGFFAGKSELDIDYSQYAIFR